MHPRRGTNAAPSGGWKEEKGPHAVTEGTAAADQSVSRLGRSGHGDLHVGKRTLAECPMKAMKR